MMSLKPCGEIDMNTDKIGLNSQCTFEKHCMKLINLNKTTDLIY